MVAGASPTTTAHGGGRQRRCGDDFGSEGGDGWVPEDEECTLDACDRLIGTEEHQGGRNALVERQPEAKRKRMAGADDSASARFFLRGGAERRGGARGGLESVDSFPSRRRFAAAQS